VAADGIAPAKGRSARPFDESLGTPRVSAEDFEEFHRRLFLPFVRRAIWRHRVPDEDARDIVQEAFVIALTKLKPGGDPGCWLIRVVDHLCVNFRRKAARRYRLQVRWGGGPPTGDAEDGALDAMLDLPEAGGDC
jgi:DNA-directed RNA polymerase specialized sigma24 family protein